MLGRLGFHEKWIGSNEVVEEAKRKKKCLILKIDYEKVYDSVNWEFFTCLTLSFHEKWIRWIRGCLVSSKVLVLVNGNLTSEFEVTKGLRQGDPIALFLFNIVAN